MQGLGPDGCEFVICFDDGNASEYNTLLVTDWFAHTPAEVLAKNFGVPAQTFANVPLHELWIFQGKHSVVFTLTQAPRDNQSQPGTLTLERW